MIVYVVLHYPDTELTSPCPILVILSAKLGSDKFVYKLGYVYM